MSGTDLERLNVILAARDKEFIRAMERNQRRVERFAARSQKQLSQTSKSFVSLGAAAKRVGPILAAIGGAAVLGRIKATVATLDDIGKTADRLGVTTDALQELRTVAESAGVSQSALDSSLERLSKRLGEAAAGGGAAAKTLKSLGLSVDELQTMGLDSALGAVADKLQAIPDPTERAAAAAALFGREGVAMVNLLREGSAGMEKMRAEARNLGIVIDEDLVRGAEDAQTKLDLMGRVISAQLNAALIELAPVLVAGATALADLARGLNSAIEAVDNFLHPQTDLMIATENLVTAMGDEIEQSRILAMSLNNGITFSQATARAKIEEARTRHENAKAALAEHRAIVLASGEYQALNSDIANAQAAMGAISAPRAEDTTLRHAAAYEEAEARLAALLVRRREMLRADAEIQKQLERTGENLATLESAVGSSGGGPVEIPGFAPILNSDKADLSGTGKAAAASIPALSDYQAVMSKIRDTLGDAAGGGRSYGQTISEINAMYRAGVIDAEEYAAAVEAIEKRFEGAKAASESLKQQTAQTFASIVTGAESASDALSNLLGNLAGQFANAAFQGLFNSAPAGGFFDAIGSLLSFDGGGRTPSGPRSGGIDGKGGFPAILHPNETVIDHTRPAPRAAGGGSSAPVIQINVTGATGNSEVREMVENGVRAGLQTYDKKVLPRSVAAIQRDPRRFG